MRSMVSKLLASVVLFLVFPIAADGGEHHDPTGYSFSYPGGWIAVTKELGKLGREALPEDVRSYLAKNNVDLGRMSIMLIRDADEEFLENVNVVVDHQEMPMVDDSRQKLVELLPGQYRSLGAEMSNVRGQLRNVGKHDAVVLDYNVKLPTVPKLLRQRQAYLAGGGNTYIVTFTANSDSFAKYEPTFDTILASFDVPAPTRKGFDWKQMAITGLVGGLAAGLLGLYQKFFKKKQPTT